MSSTIASTRSLLSRDRSGVQDRHHLPDPRESIANVKHWENGVLKQRVADLYKTLPGLRGHVLQIQQELNRVSLKNLDGLSGRHVRVIKNAVNNIIRAVERAKDSASFKLPGNLTLGLAYTNWVVI